MTKYRVWVRLECEYDDIEAEDEEDAFIQASDYAMSGDSWDWHIEKIEDIKEDFYDMKGD